MIVERPTYDRTLLSLRNRGADVRMVELEPDGIDVAALERVLAAGAQPKLAHIIPNFQNPAGYTLSAEKRERLLELARQHEFTIFEDDPYVALRFEGEPLPTMLSMDGDTVVYASSFSKTVCPGIRVGYLVGPEELIARIAKIATEHVHLAEHGLAGDRPPVLRLRRARQVDRDRRKALHERADTLCAALERELPDARFVKPEGGYFLWVDLPEGTDVGGAVRARPRSAASSSSRARTSCSTEASRACGSPTRASPPRRSRKGSSASPRRTTRCRAASKASMRPEEIAALGDLASEAAAGADQADPRLPHRHRRPRVAPGRTGRDPGQARPRPDRASAPTPPPAS